MTGSVLDASAVIALFKDEPGADRVASALGDAAMSTVNLCEVVAWFARGPLSEEDAWQTLAGLGLKVIPFDADLARAAGFLFRSTRATGVSLADHACLALGQRMGVPVLTADRAWATLKLGVEIELIR